MGTDLVSGKIRFAYGIVDFYDGIDLVPMVIGLFGISEVLINMESTGERMVFEKRVKNLLPNLQDWKKSIFPILRGSILGFLIGIIPGGGAVLSSFFSYTVEKRISKHPEEFGKGAIEGVAAPETANNAAVGGAFIPLFALGIPSNVVMALLLASFSIHGVAPSAGFIAKNPVLFWGIICSMYLGNIMLLILNLPLIGLWVKILEIPYKILFPLILLFCVVGSYSINYKTFDIMIMVIFGLIGYFLKKFGYEPAPLVLAFVLGPLLEYSFRQTMIIGSHKLYFIFTKPIALVCLLVTFLLILSSLFRQFMELRKKVMESVKEN
jgi:putative tricarboxylic transport membrane protein